MSSSPAADELPGMMADCGASHPTKMVPPIPPLATPLVPPVSPSAGNHWAAGTTPATSVAMRVSGWNSPNMSTEKVETTTPWSGDIKVIRAEAKGTRERLIFMAGLGRVEFGQSPFTPSIALLVLRCHIFPFSRKEKARTPEGTGFGHANGICVYLAGRMTESMT